MLSITTITNDIASLNMTGIDTRNLNNIPDKVHSRDCPILFPDPDNFYVSVSAERKSMGRADSAYWIVNRTLTYRFLFTEVGTGRGLLEFYQGLAEAQDTIVTAFLTNEFEIFNITGIGISDYGVVTDSAGTKFFGFTVTLQTQESIN